MHVSGGWGSGADPAGTQTTLTVFFANCANMDTDSADDKSTLSREKEGPPSPCLCVSWERAPPRVLDPTFLADFDVVIATYSALALEYLKQTRSLEEGDEVVIDSENKINGKPAKTTKSGICKWPAPNGTEAMWWVNADDLDGCELDSA